MHFPVGLLFCVTYFNVIILGRISHINLISYNWVKFDVSDIQKVADGKFPGVDKDSGKALLRAYYLEGIRDKYHKIGDIKPLFMINKETNEFVVGFLHKDDTVTLVSVKDYLNQDDFYITPSYDASFNIWGASFLNEGLIWDESMYTIVADGFSLTDADKLDRIIVTLDIYVNGGRKDYTSKTAYNDYYVSLSNTYGHPQPIGDDGHLWELICSHWGILGEEIGYNSSGDILYISN
ncbi:hypothetical protein [Desulfitibacter alkalitolerans]|uniref:hypothetical protein n=1 Tax=Desulfitibacter alkalitolerans TaxID=264641 RepID=UPI000488335D|nr:hypothetical protein [Desulfitibacter alkalitolerans]